MEFCDFCENLVILRESKELFSDETTKEVPTIATTTAKTTTTTNEKSIISDDHSHMPSKHLVFFCENCECEKIPQKNLNHLHYRTSVDRDNNFYFSTIINKYTSLDITYPRTKMRCPSCSSHSQSEFSEVIYISYDKSKMKYLFQCTKCGYGWRNTMQMDNILETEIK